MTARLRIVPILSRRDGEPSHYVIIDRCTDIPIEKMGDAGRLLREVVGVPALIFAFEVDLPDHCLKCSAPPDHTAARYSAPLRAASISPETDV